MKSALEAVAELVRRESGMTFDGNRVEGLRAAIARVQPGADPIAFLRRLRSPAGGRAALDALVDEVTVNETYFYRERAQIDAIPWHELLASAHARGDAKVRVWSAACSTGEEVYTLAMAASETFAPVAPPVEVVGTDLSVTVLGRAWEGRYRARAVREIEPHVRDRWLARVDGGWEVLEPLRRLVRFERHNLTRDPVPPLGESRFDLIVLRNVLIYFDAPTSAEIVGRLRRALHPGGALVLGSADVLCETTRRLAEVTAPTPSDPIALRERRPVRPRRAASAAPALATPDPIVEVLDADAAFADGLTRLEAGEAGEAITSLRRALYLDPAFAVAAFMLGRAHDELDDRVAAARAYRQALRALDSTPGGHHAQLQQIDGADVAAACRARLLAIGDALS